jgi:hypothetical protein
VVEWLEAQAMLCIECRKLGLGDCGLWWGGQMRV